MLVNFLIRFLALFLHLFLHVNKFILVFKCSFYSRSTFKVEKSILIAAKPIDLRTIRLFMRLDFDFVTIAELFSLGFNDLMEVVSDWVQCLLF